MNINVEHQPNCRAVLRFEIPADFVKKERASVTTYFSNIAKIPGYRPGKVPPALIASRFKDAIEGELKQRLIQSGLRKAIEDKKVDLLQVLKVEDDVLGIDNVFTYTAEVTTSPKVDLPDYKGITVKLERVEVSDHDVDHELYHLRERFQELTDTEDAAAMDDVVMLNYTATVDGQAVGEAFPNLPEYFAKSEGNMYLLSKEENFLPGFYAALVGIKTGDQRELSLPLPEDFHAEELKGKTLVIAANCVGVKHRKLPELDDEFALKVHKELTMETLRKEVHDSVRQRKEKARDAAYSNQVLEHLTSNTTFEVPQSYVDREAQRRTNDIAMQAMRRGMDQELLMQQQDEIVSAATQQAQMSVKISFILGEIAKAEGIEASDAQVSYTLEQMARRSGKSPKKFYADLQKRGVIDNVRDDLTLQNTLEHIKGLAVVEEIEPAAPEKHGCAFEEA